MSSIILLTRLQIMQSLGSVRAAVEKRAGTNGAMAGTVLIFAVVLVGLGWLGHAAYGLVGAYGIETPVYNILFMACGTLTFVFSLPAVLGSFFGSSDINDLLPLPVSPFAIVLSKALGALSASYLWTLLFIAGPLLGWGIAAGEGVSYWIMYVLAIIFTPFMPTAYAGTISIVIAAIFKRVRRKDAITTIATLLTLGISVAAFFISNNLHLSEGTAQAISNVGQAMGTVVMVFPAYGFAVYALVHVDPLGMCLYVLISLLAFIVFVVVARLLYMRIVTSLSSGAGSANAYDGSTVQEQAPVFKALATTEIRKITRNSSVLINYVAYPAVITPVLFGVMLMSGSLSDTIGRLAGFGDVNRMVAGFVLVFLMFLATLGMCSNKIACTEVSREGSNWIHMKFIPVPIATQVRAKILPAFVVNVFITLVVMGGGGYLVASRGHISPLIVVFGTVLMIAGAWLMVCIGAWSESRGPRVEWGNDGDVNVKSLGGGADVLRAVLVGLAYSALPLLVTPLTNLDPFVFMPVIAVVGVVVAIVLGRILLAKTAQNIAVFE